MGFGLITVRPFEAGDISAAVAMEAANQPVPWSASVFSNELVAENRSYLVAGDHEMAGFGGVMVIGDEAHITNLLVSPERRKEGIGSALMRHLIANAVGMGARHLTLEVRAGNEAARALYAKFGLVPVGFRPGYYQGEDALIMWAHDIDSPDYLGRSGV